MPSSNDVHIIRRAIMEVIAFFDLFDYPMAEFEIWRHLNLKRGLKQVKEVLKNMEQLGKKNGFYFLRGRGEIVEIRRERYNFTDRKFKRALRVARLFKFIPWIRMIAVGNMIGGNNLKDKSDIDFFIITDKKRIWLTRFFCAGLAKFLGLRPSKANKQDKICLSFYVAEDALDMRKLMLADEKEAKPLRLAGANRSGLASYGDDPYFVYWLSNLVPIYDRNKAYRQLIKANAWIYEYLPNWQPVKTVDLRNSGRPFNFIYRDIVDLLIGGLESLVKKWQLRILPKELKLAMNKGTDVVVNDSILKLYATDKRAEYRDKFQKKLREFKKEDFY